MLGLLYRTLQRNKAVGGTLKMMQMIQWMCLPPEVHRMPSTRIIRTILEMHGVDLMARDEDFAQGDPTLLLYIRLLVE